MKELFFWLKLLGLGVLLGGTGIGGISDLIHGLRGFEQQGIDGFGDGALPS